MPTLKTVRILSVVTMSIGAMGLSSGLASTELVSLSINAGGGGADSTTPAIFRIGGAPVLRHKKAAKTSPAAAPGPVIGLDPAFRLGELYAFPNPARQSDNPTIHVETGIADAVELRFYDAAGDPVHQAVLTAAPEILNDGQGPQYAYEYVWPGEIPSGVYLCRVTARKAGFDDLIKTVRLAVVR